MRLPVDALTQRGGDGSSPDASKLQGTSRPRPSPFAEIFSDEYHLARESARFLGQARLEHPQMKLRCPTIEVQFLPDRGKISRIVAAPNVVFELSDEKGQLHGTGEKAVYTYAPMTSGTNDLIELTGNPATLESTNGTVENSLIILDRGRNRIITPGKYRIWGIAERRGAPKKR